MDRPRRRLTGLTTTPPPTPPTPPTTGPEPTTPARRAGVASRRAEARGRLGRRRGRRWGRWLAWGLAAGLPLAFLAVFFAWPVTVMVGRGFVVDGALDLGGFVEVFSRP
ncbi:MAG: hypothetical protein LBU50_04225, partial [Cellulomonas sp.]|nr:hypothetical protein [Cellulomonas sp.]